MKIVVLAGGLSPERNVSLSTGTMVTEALRALGHRAGLIDLYFGLETGGADEAFFDAPVSEAYKKISREAPAARPEGGQPQHVRPRGAGVVPDGRHGIPGPPRHLRRGRAGAGRL